MCVCECVWPNDYCTVFEFKQLLHCLTVTGGGWCFINSHLPMCTAGVTHVFPPAAKATWRDTPEMAAIFQGCDIISECPVPLHREASMGSRQQPFYKVE